MKVEIIKSEFTNSTNFSTPISDKESNLNRKNDSKVKFQILDMPECPEPNRSDSLIEKVEEMKARGDLDHFIDENSKIFAGRHLVIDVWGAKNLDDLDIMEQAMCKGVEKSGATLLHIHLHHFTPNYGVSGVAILSESHISVHTWPECNYAAFDVFMCGDARPREFVKVLDEYFSPEKIHVSEIHRGIVKNK